MSVVPTMTEYILSFSQNRCDYLQYNVIYNYNVPLFVIDQEVGEGRGY